MSEQETVKNIDDLLLFQRQTLKIKKKGWEYPKIRYFIILFFLFYCFAAYMAIVYNNDIPLVLVFPLAFGLAYWNSKYRIKMFKDEYNEKYNLNIGDKIFDVHYNKIQRKKLVEYLSGLSQNEKYLIKLISLLKIRMETSKKKNLLSYAPIAGFLTIVASVFLPLYLNSVKTTGTIDAILITRWLVISLFPIIGVCLTVAGIVRYFEEKANASFTEYKNLYNLLLEIELELHIRELSIA